MADKQTFTVPWHCEWCQRDNIEMGVEAAIKELHLDCICGAYYDITFEDSLIEIWNNPIQEHLEHPWKIESIPGTPV
jgi:hypothetical protein